MLELSDAFVKLKKFVMEILVAFWVQIIVILLWWAEFVTGCETVLLGRTWEVNGGWFEINFGWRWLFFSSWRLLVDKLLVMKVLGHYFFAIWRDAPSICLDCMYLVIFKGLRLWLLNVFVVHWYHGHWLVEIAQRLLLLLIVVHHGPSCSCLVQRWLKILLLLQNWLGWQLLLLFKLIHSWMELIIWHWIHRCIPRLLTILKIIHKRRCHLLTAVGHMHLPQKPLLILPLPLLIFQKLFILLLLQVQLRFLIP